MNPKAIIIRSDAPSGWLISDLVEDGYCGWNDRCTLSFTNESQHFQIINNRLCTKNSLSQLQDRSIAITVKATAPERTFAVSVNITASSSCPSFSAYIYNATLRNDIAPETLISFDKEIEVVNVPNSVDLHISIISNSTNLPFLLSHSKRQNIHYTKLYISRRLRPSDGIFQSFYIGALDKRNLIRLAVARIDVSLKEVHVSAPKFNNVHYFKQMNELRSHVTVLRVTAKTPKGAVVYRIEPEDAPFDVTPFSGDIFSRYPIPNGKYLFDVVATDSFAQKINLRPDEKVIFAPVITDYLKIHGNGLIELIKPLNYELEMLHEAAVQISGLFKGQSVVILTSI
ncbi:unnamed protein product [Litomosoides sigmodontis]|uniref:Cadherin domain-containing protein n=1 Tax=Litomosoides sigmodontis TaxID=42156 RepID=A0A3P6TVD6_LITSI|nr:unnamed protein product [Litomosoides sigmodontis]